MKKFYILAIAIGLTSCFSMKRPSYVLFEAYQIGNFSSEDVTISFFQQGEPKTVYAEFTDGGFATDLSHERKECAELWSGTQMHLAAGQTAIFFGSAYYPGNDSTLTHFALNMDACGTSDGSFSMFNFARFFACDSVTISTLGAEENTFPLLNGESWETWYDEKAGIYYHFWRILDE